MEYRFTPTQYPLPVKRKKTDWEKIKEYRMENKELFTCIRVYIKWEVLDSIYKKQGRSEEFKIVKKDLEKFIRRNAEYADSIKRYCERHGFSWSNYK